MAPNSAACRVKKGPAAGGKLKSKFLIGSKNTVQLLELGKDMSQGQSSQKINEEFWIIILMRSSYVTASWGGDEDGAGFTGLHHCDGHTTVTCYWRDFVALALHHGKMARKLVMEPVLHKTSDILSHSGTLFTKADTHIRQPKAYCTHYLHTHTHRHTDTHSSTQTHE